MTDYFALLGQPRLPWLDSDELKQAFHERTLRAHPDAQAAGDVDAAVAEAAFAEINEGYQTLLDPKRRLHHLLCLEGAPPAKGGDVPTDIAAFFQMVAESNQAADRVLQKSAGSANPLGRALLQSEFLRARRSVEASLEKLLNCRGEAEAELRRLSQTFHETSDRLPSLSSLYLRFSYLTRWIDQLEEKRNQITSALL